MKAIIDEQGLLHHERGDDRYPVRCPYAVASSEEWSGKGGEANLTRYSQEVCGDWCSLWREIKAVNNLDTLWIRRDCRGHEHAYDAYEDQRETAEDA